MAARSSIGRVGPDVTAHQQYVRSGLAACANRFHRRARRAQQQNQFEVVGLLVVHPGELRVLRLLFLEKAFFIHIR
jgi:hypothetical protein